MEIASEYDHLALVEFTLGFVSELDIDVVLPERICIWEKGIWETEQIGEFKLGECEVALSLFSDKLKEKSLGVIDAIRNWDLLDKYDTGSKYGVFDSDIGDQFIAAIAEAPERTRLIQETHLIISEGKAFRIDVLYQHKERGLTCFLKEGVPVFLSEAGSLPTCWWGWLTDIERNWQGQSRIGLTLLWFLVSNCRKLRFLPGERTSECFLNLMEDGEIEFRAPESNILAAIRWLGHESTPFNKIREGVLSGKLMRFVWP